MGTLSNPYLTTLCEDVQFNCAISDARYARDYSLCIYLLRMREFYRWRFDIPLTQQIQTDSVGDWISDMEAQWDEIEELDFKPLSVNGNTFDPFDSQSINEQLQSSNLVYSAGYGRLGQPHFVLAELIQQRVDGALTSFECGKEWARDSITMPAMTQQQSIYIRHDSIKRHISQMVDEWSLQKHAGPLARVIDHYQLNNSKSVEQHIESAAIQLSPLYREHERGEVAAGDLLGTRYHQLLQKTAGTRNEFYLRAVRDVLADCLMTWPYLIEQRSEIALDFWLASLTGARLEYLTESGTTTQLQSESNDEQARLNHLSAIVETEQQRWLHIAQQLMDKFTDNGEIDIKSQTLSLIQSPLTEPQ